MALRARCSAVILVIAALPIVPAAWVDAQSNQTASGNRHTRRYPKAFLRLSVRPARLARVKALVAHAPQPNIVRCRAPAAQTRTCISGRTPDCAARVLTGRTLASPSGVGLGRRRERE